jgi:hypothetical protein
MLAYHIKHHVALATTKCKGYSFKAETNIGGIGSKAGRRLTGPEVLGALEDGEDSAEYSCEVWYQ